MRKLVNLSGINFKDSPSVRYELNDDAVREYATAYLMEDKLPPPLLYQTELHGLLICDGLHRITAQQSNQVKQMICEVRVGTRSECFLAAVRENLTHGVRRTSADKRQAIATAIAIYPDLANLKIAEICHVSHSTVTETRKQMEATGTLIKRETIKTKDGKTRTANNRDKEKKLPKNQSQSLNSEISEGDNDGLAHPPGVAGADNGVATAKVVVDATGYPIPEKALPVWERRFEITAIIDDLRNTKHELAGYAAAKDPLVTEVNLNAADCELESLISRLKSAVPYAVCPMCQGKLPEHCKGCNTRGMVSQTKYERTDEALKKARQSASLKRLSK